MKEKVMNGLEKFSKAMLSPLSYISAAGLILVLGALLTSTSLSAMIPVLQWTPIKLLGQLIYNCIMVIINNLSLMFCVGIAAALAKKNKQQAAIIGLMSYFMYLTAGNVTLTQLGMLAEPDPMVGLYGTGQSTVFGIQTVDMGVFGGILLGLVCGWVYNRTCEKQFKGIITQIYSGNRWSFTCMVVFSILFGFGSCFFWPPVQSVISALTDLIATSGNFGLFLYGFLERFLIPTGLHHFVYGPFIFGPAVVEGGLQVYWAEHLQAFSQSTEPLKTLFPEGGFALHGNSKVFGSVGIALALYFTAAPENRVKVAGLLIPATLTAMLVGITEPLEFTFLFISPLLFAVHAVLAASMATVMYICGVVGNFGGGLLDQFLPQNWIPMFHHHASMMFIQIGIGLCFTALYFVVFRTLILRLNLKTPGREESEIKLYSKADYQAARGKTTAAAAPETRLGQAAGFLQALGGASNIESINNCATRLRIALVDMAKTQSDDVFKALGAHGVVRRGNGIQVIVGLHVPQVRDQLENLMKDSLSTEHTTMTEAVS